MRRWGSEEGAAYVEFLLAFVPILTLFLGLVQIGLLYAGNLVVQHAAHRARVPAPHPTEETAR